MAEGVFDVGHRVMITEWGTDPQCGELHGYFGHITHISSLSLCPYWVMVEGRVGRVASPHILGFAWPFEASSLEHAD